jgi:hypothetical protein
VTPGFAKTRAELPWLYYPRNDRVIINAHNFTPTPVGFGNELLLFRGPTGVTNLGSLGGSGTYNGGMGVVSDTGSNGVSAFDFVGASSQWLATPAVANISTGSIGFWVKSSTAGRMAIYAEHASDSAFATVDIGGNSTASYGDESINYSCLTSSAVRRGCFSNEGTDAYQDGTWKHIVLTVENAARKIYVNATLKSVAEPFGSTNDFFLNVSGTSHAIGRRFFTGSPLHLTARLDDFRVLPSILTAGQISAWYSAGRGYDA